MWIVPTRSSRLSGLKSTEVAELNRHEPEPAEAGWFAASCSTNDVGTPAFAGWPPTPFSTRITPEPPFWQVLSSAATTYTTLPAVRKTCRAESSRNPPPTVTPFTFAPGTGVGATAPPELEIVTETGALVVVAPALSRAKAVSVCDPS